MSKLEKSGQDKFLDAIQPFVIGGLSGMLATCFIQPIDMVKVTIQLKS
jgi:solute carrier family 25 oxoglutarate transporter 11